MTFGEILLKFASPVLGALGGLGAAAWKATSRVTHLEHGLELVNKSLEGLRVSEKEARASLSSGFSLAMAQQRDDLEEKVKELKEELETLDESFTQYTRSSVHDFANNEDFRRFMEDWQKQCHHIQRTLGQIEGLVKRDTLLMTTQTPRG